MSAKAIETLQRDSFFFEAQRICETRGWSSIEDVEHMAESLRYRQYLRDIQPFMDKKVDIALTANPKWIRYPDGRIEMSDDGLSPEMRKTLAMLDDCIAQVAENYGFRTAPQASK